MRILSIVLVAGLAASPGAAIGQLAAPAPSSGAPVGGAAALRPVQVVEPGGGPTVVRLTAGASPTVALRVSVPVEEGPSEGGAARVIQLLALERARSAAAAIGARVNVTRTPWGVAYAVEGAAADFDHLAYVLREALAEPVPDAVAFERARSRTLDEALRLRETAAGRITSTLREAVVGGQRLVEGTPATVRGLDRGLLRDLWARTHRRGRMTVVVVGDVPAELVLASFRDVGAGGGDGPAPPESPAPSDGTVRTEVLRSWYGEAREAGDLTDPRGLVAADLVARHLDAARDGRTETRLEVWAAADRRVLAVVGAAYPGEGAGLRALVRGVMEDALREAGAEDVRGAVARLRARLLLDARTATGLAELVGRYRDATGDPSAAAALVEALADVDVDDVRALSRELAARTPARAELLP